MTGDSYSCDGREYGILNPNDALFIVKAPEENHGWRFINVEDTVSLIVGTIYECLRNKNTALLYDVFLDADLIDENCLENKFYKVLTF